MTLSWSLGSAVVTATEVLPAVTPIDKFHSNVNVLTILLHSGFAVQCTRRYVCVNVCLFPCNASPSFDIYTQSCVFEVSLSEPYTCMFNFAGYLLTLVPFFTVLILHYWFQFLLLSYIIPYSVTLHVETAEQTTDWKGTRLC